MSAAFTGERKECLLFVYNYTLYAVYVPIMSTYEKAAVFTKNERMYNVCGHSVKKLHSLPVEKLDIH